MPRELLFSVTRKDLRIDTFKAGGKGGQHQNKSDTGVRITHPPSGAVGESREHRSQYENKRAAFAKMAADPKFEAWRKIEASRRLGVLADIDKKVADSMKPANIRVEVHDDEGRWVETEMDRLS